MKYFSPHSYSMYIFIFSINCCFCKNKIAANAPLFLITGSIVSKTHGGLIKII